MRRSRSFAIRSTCAPRFIRPPYDANARSSQEIRKIAIELQPGVIHAYVKALQIVFLIGVGAGACASLSAMLIRNLRFVLSSFASCVLADNLRSVKGRDLMAGGA